MIYRIMRMALITQVIMNQLHAAQPPQSSRHNHSGDLTKVPVVKPQFFDVPLRKSPDQITQDSGQAAAQSVPNKSKKNESSGCKGMCSLQ